MTVVPGWFSRRRQGIIAALAVAGALGIAAFVNYQRNSILASYVTAQHLSAGASVRMIEEWLHTRREQAVLASALVAELPSAAADRPRALAATLRALVQTGGFISATVRDAGGRAVAVEPASSARDAAPVAPSVDSALVSAARDASGRPVVVIVTPLRARGGVDVPEGPRATLELRIAAGHDAVPNLNPTGEDSSTQRTWLVAPGATARTELVVLAAAGLRVATEVAEGSAWPRERSEVAALVPARAPSSGEATGLARQPALYSVWPVPGTDWTLVRTRDRGDLERLLARPLRINALIFSVSLALILGIVIFVWRVAYLTRAQEAATIRATFVSSMSHELRTPLTQIRMYAEMLRGGLLAAPADSDRALRIIEKEAGRLTLLVERTLAFTRGETPPPGAPAEPTPVVEALRLAAASFAPLALERGVQVEIHARDEGALTVAMDRDALQQVLLNLLDNAIKYGPRGQVVRIDATRGTATVRIAVADDGPGVSAAEADEIWRAFARGRAAADSGEAGSGIGLSVVRDLVIACGGRVWCEDRDGARGARFVVELPAGAA